MVWELQSAYSVILSYFRHDLSHLLINMIVLSFRNIASLPHVPSITCVILVTFTPKKKNSVQSTSQILRFIILLYIYLFYTTSCLPRNISKLEHFFRCHGRQIQHSLSVRASSIQVHRDGTRRYHQVGVGYQPAQRHIRVLYGKFIVFSPEPCVFFHSNTLTDRQAHRHARTETH